MKGDTVRRNRHSYGEERHLIFRPKEIKRIRYLTWERINFEGLRFIKVNYNIDYGFNDTVFYREKGRYPRYQYSDEVVFDIQKILHPCYELKNE